MNAFWESFDVGVETGVEVMGEPITINGEPWVGIVEPIDQSAVASSGGTRNGMDFNVTISDVATVEDGYVIVARGMTGAVYSIEWISPTKRILHCGPVNRWEV